MFRTTLNASYLKRTIRPLYGWTQSTPASQFVDPAWDRSVDIYPGMCLMKTVGENVTLVDGTGDPYGLAAFFMAPVLGIDEITEQGINAVAVWKLGPDAEFEILAPAFDSTATWTEPTNGTTLLVHAVTTGSKRGQLCPAGATNASTKPIARLIKINSSTKITVGGLQARTA